VSLPKQVADRARAAVRRSGGARLSADVADALEEKERAIVPRLVQTDLDEVKLDDLSTLLGEMRPARKRFEREVPASERKRKPGGQDPQGRGQHQRTSDQHRLLTAAPLSCNASVTEFRDRALDDRHGDRQAESASAARRSASVRAHPVSSSDSGGAGGARWFFSFRA
jgi:hypothetical protein